MYNLQWLIKQMSKEITEFDRLRGERLLNERKRMGKNQKDSGLLIGVTVQTWLAYEKGSRKLDHEQISLLYEAGFDVMFLISGNKSVPSLLSQSEQELIRLFHQVPENDHSALIKMIRAFAISSSDDS